MLNTKYQRYAERLNELIEEGTTVAKLEKLSNNTRYIQGEDKIRLHAWLANTRNILTIVFGKQSPHFHHFEDVLPKNGIQYVEHSYEIYPVVGVLQGALSDLEKGYLIGQEFIIAGDLFDSILEQAKHLAQNGYKDPAAVLARTVLEDTLKRLARSENIDAEQKASVLNDELKKLDKYPQPQWRFIQAWLDIGNSAAHGKFDDYTKEAVVEMIVGVEHFLITDFRK